MEKPTFNLWTEPWITLERPDGSLEKHGIAHALLNAQDYRGLYEQSPLVIVGIHRLLVGILQDALRPDDLPKLKKLWQQVQFPAEPIRAFGEQYGHRFDVFSTDAPFLQSSDIPKQLEAMSDKERLDALTSIAGLLPELPSGSFVIHYRHQLADDHIFCPACAAKGLVIMPAFTTEGGQGNWKSINGTPPIYVLPTGTTLFESLHASLVTRQFQPGKHLAPKDDLAWWKRAPIVRHCKNPKKGQPVPEENQHLQLAEVGYLHGLTFTPRRVWLKAEPMNVSCTYCGQGDRWGVRRMVFSAGENAVGDLLWQDPFVSYRPGKKEGDRPWPIAPKKEFALWREYVGLFLPESGNLTASVLRQIANITQGEDDNYTFRCIGAVTHHMSFDEWLDVEMRVPLRLLRDPARGQRVRDGFSFAEDCSKRLFRHFKRAFVPTGSRKSKAKKVNDGLLAQMQTRYWSALAETFLGKFVLEMKVDDWQSAYRQWADIVVRQAYRAFQHAAESASLKGMTVSQRAEALSGCRADLFVARKKHLNEKGIDQ